MQQPVTARLVRFAAVHRLVPVGLALFTRGVLLGDIDLWTGPQLHRTLAPAHVYCRTVASAICTSGRSLVIAHPDAMRGMAQLTRRASVPFQNAVDKLGHRPGSSA